MNYIHIHDKSLLPYEFVYFFCTHVEENYSWTSSEYYGILITNSGLPMKVKIPESMYSEIPSKLKNQPILSSFYRFRINQEGTIISNLTSK